MKCLLGQLILLLTLSACKGPYSALDPAGSAATIIAEMFWWLVGVGTIIWIMFVGLQFYTSVLKPSPHNRKKTSLFIIGGGAVFPVIIIGISIYYSLRPLPELVTPAPAGSLKIRVSGAQWWWRVKYGEGEEEVELANELWLPLNEPVQFLLSSEDVIHAFWLPSLAGKMDMIPGRTTTLSFTPTKMGRYFGICAEYCGASHALMRLNAKVVERKVFDEWLEHQRRPAVPPEDIMARRGKKAFVSNGCTSCHTVRGVSSNGMLGPDLTHVGSRYRIGAGILDNSVHAMEKFIENTGVLKPEVKMPSFEAIPEEERKAMAIWLEGLK